MKAIVFFIIVVGALGYLGYREIPAVQSAFNNHSGRHADSEVNIQDTVQDQIKQWLARQSSENQSLVEERFVQMEFRIAELERAIENRFTVLGPVIQDPIGSIVNQDGEFDGESFEDYVNELDSHAVKASVVSSNRETVLSLRQISDRMTLRSVEYQLN